MFYNSKHPKVANQNVRCRPRKELVTLFRQWRVTTWHDKRQATRKKLLIIKMLGLLGSGYFFGADKLSEIYANPPYNHDFSLPELPDGSLDPDNRYRGHCNEPGCPCKCYRYDTGSGCTNIRCSMCNHTPLQHVHGRPPVPRPPIERLRSQPYGVREFDRPVGQSFSVELKTDYSYSISSPQWCLLRFLLPSNQRYSSQGSLWLLRDIVGWDLVLILLSATSARC